jgi:hypothetical protein
MWGGGKNGKLLDWRNKGSNRMSTKPQYYLTHADMD